MKRFRTLQPFSQQDADYFCRHVLPELEVFRRATTSTRFASAGETLGKTRQGVSLATRRVEKALREWFEEVPLLNRSRRPMTLTEAGETLLSFAQDALRQSEEFMERMRRLQVSGEVRLATIYAPWLTYGAEVVAAYRERVKDGSINLSLVIGPSYMRTIEAAVREGRADIGITSYPPKITPPLCITHLPPQEYQLVFSSSYSRLAKLETLKRRGKLKLERVISDNPDLKIVILKRAFDVPATNQIIAYLNRAESDLGPEQKIQVDNLSQTKDMLQNMPGTMAILQRVAIRNEVAKGLFKAYSLDPPLKPWTWGIIFREHSSRPAVREFLQCLVPIMK